MTGYAIGDDVLAQFVSEDDGGWTHNLPQYLMYDGHGSTRQLIASDGTTIDDSYSYDGYGMMLGGNPTDAAPAETNLLYAGEQYDTASGSYYLRARYYNPSSGTFNRVDPYAGNNADPQSLHKYAYCHNNPINAIDPSGMTLLSVAIKTVTIASIVISIARPVYQIAISIKQSLELVDFTNLIRRLANNGVIDQLVADSIRKEAMETFAELIENIGESLFLIAKEIAMYYAYNLAFAAVTQVAMGGIKASAKLSKMAVAKLKFGNVLIDKHHLIFKCAVKKGVRQRLFYLPATSHKGALVGLHSRIASHPRFWKLQPRKGRNMEAVIKSFKGAQNWLDELGRCYKWLETRHSHFKGIHKAFEQAVVDIGGAKGIKW